MNGRLVSYVTTFYVKDLQFKPSCGTGICDPNKSRARHHRNNTCLAVITLDSVLKKDDNYCPLVFLGKCKYIEKKVIRHIIDNLSHFSSSDKPDQE